MALSLIGARAVESMLFVVTSRTPSRGFVLVPSIS